MLFILGIGLTAFVGFFAVKYYYLYTNRLLSFEEFLNDCNNSKKQQLKELTKAIDDYTLMLQGTKNTYEDLKQKQASIAAEKQRERDAKQNINLYQLHLSNEDIKDIESLRNIQGILYNKDPIDKIIWESFYKAPFDKLMSNIIPIERQSKKNSGIYKITSSDGLVYIGQSVDIKERLKTHIKNSISHIPSSNKLYKTMQQQKPENFTFEIIEFVNNKTDLDKQEYFWIDFYKTKEYGLNSTKGNS